MQVSLGNDHFTAAISPLMNMRERTTVYPTFTVTRSVSPPLGFKISCTLVTIMTRGSEGFDVILDAEREGA